MVDWPFMHVYLDFVSINTLHDTFNTILRDINRVHQRDDCNTRRSGFRYM